VQTKRLRPVAFKFGILEAMRLEASAATVPLKEGALKHEIKSATRHEVQVKRTRTGWTARVLLDV